MKLAVPQQTNILRKQGIALLAARTHTCSIRSNVVRQGISGNSRLRTGVTVNAAEVTSTCSPSTDEPYILLSTDPVELLAEINRLRQENSALKQALVESNIPVDPILAKAVKGDNFHTVAGHDALALTAGVVAASPATRTSPQPLPESPRIGSQDVLPSDSRVKRGMAGPKPRTPAPGNASTSTNGVHDANGAVRNGVNGGHGAVRNGMNGVIGGPGIKTPPAASKAPPPPRPTATPKASQPSISDAKAAAATGKPRVQPAAAPRATPAPPSSMKPTATRVIKPTAPATPTVKPARVAAAPVPAAPSAFVVTPVEPAKPMAPKTAPKAPTVGPAIPETLAAVAAPAAPAKPSLPAPTQEQLDRLKGRKMGHYDFPLETDDPMDIVFVSSEVAPWSKTGGLGDVAGSLPIGLAARGHRVMVVAPRYQHGSKSDALYDCAFDAQCRVTLDMGAAGQHEVALFHCHKDNVDWVFVDHAVYHRAGTPYCDGNGMAHEDNVFRYTLLSLAACEVPLILHVGGFRSGSAPGFPYGDNCVFVANDWHAGLVPVYIASRYRPYGVYKNARTIFAIHNLSHQGVEPSDIFPYLGLPESWYEPVSWRFPDWARITGPAVNILKGGLVCADRLVTVSQGYAWEVTTPEGGWGLHELLTSKSHVLNGITNGIDMDEWDPATDTFIEANYSAYDLAGKAKCKAAIQAELGLEVNPDIPLLGFIGRLDFQKGPDVVLDAVQQLVERGVQVIMLGSGMPDYENAMRAHEETFKRNFRGWVGFSVPVAHQIIAGSDILLMPSRFEPCGLNQLFAMRYGTVPIAHATGGLRDTIKDFNGFADEPSQMGTGWTFGPPEPEPMLRCLDSALKVFREDKDTWTEVQLNGMCDDLSWARSAHQYEQIFKWARIDNPLCNNPW